jgi:tetratricopeptide (TPR) repeat protein
MSSQGAAGSGSGAARERPQARTRTTRFSTPLPDDPREEHTIRLARVDALHWLGRADMALEELRELSAIEAAHPDAIGASARAETLRRLADCLQARGQYAEAEAAARRCIEVAQAAGEAATAVRARARLAGALVVLARADEAREEVERAVADAEGMGDPAALGHALVASASLQSCLGRPAQALAAYRRARAAFDAAGNLVLAAHAAVNVGAALSALGDFETARPTLEQTAAHARSLGLRRVEGWSLQNLGLVLGRLGDTEAGLAALDRAREIATSMDDPRLAAASLLYRSVLLRGVDSGRALLDAEEGVAICAASRLETLEPLCRMARAAALIDRGSHAEALSDVDRALGGRAGARTVEEGEIELLALRGEALEGLGRTAEAADSRAAARARLAQELSRIDDSRLRRTFRENHPHHARLIR